MTRKRRKMPTAWNSLLAFFGKDLRATRKQRRFLGDAYSERIAGLIARLEEMSGQRTVFDRDIRDEPPFGIPGGAYYLGEAVPRISLPIGASELTVAHELLHGILYYEDYPSNMTPRKRFDFMSDVVQELFHCSLHVVIDYRLHALGYDVLAYRVEKAEVRLPALRS